MRNKADTGTQKICFTIYLLICYPTKTGKKILADKKVFSYTAKFYMRNIKSICPETSRLHRHFLSFI